MSTRRRALYVFIPLITLVPGLCQVSQAQEVTATFEGTLDLAQITSDSGEVVENVVTLEFAPTGGPVSGGFAFTIEGVQFEIRVLDSEPQYPDCAMTWEMTGDIASGNVDGGPGIHSIEGTAEATLRVDDVEGCGPGWEPGERTGTITWQARFYYGSGRVEGSFDFNEETTLPFAAEVVSWTTTTTEPPSSSTTEPSASTTSEPTTGTSEGDDGEGSEGLALDEAMAAINILPGPDCPEGLPDDSYLWLVKVCGWPGREAGSQDYPEVGLAPYGSFVTARAGYAVCLDGPGGDVVYAKGPCEVRVPCPTTPDVLGTSLGLLKGLGFFRYDPNRGRITVDTPHVAAAVLGTQFVLDVGESSTRVLVIEGTVQVEGREGGLQLVGAGEWTDGSIESVAEPQALAQGQLEAEYPDLMARLPEFNGAPVQAREADDPTEAADATTDDSNRDTVLIVAIAGGAAVVLLGLVLFARRQSRKAAPVGTGSWDHPTEPPPPPPPG